MAMTPSIEATHVSQASQAWNTRRAQMASVGRLARDAGYARDGWGEASQASQASANRSTLTFEHSGRSGL